MHYARRSLLMKAKVISAIIDVVSLNDSHEAVS